MRPDDGDRLPNNGEKVGGILSLKWAGPNQEVRPRGFTMSVTLPGRLDQRQFGSILVANVFLLMLPFWVVTYMFQDALLSGNRQAPNLFGLSVEMGIAPIGVVAVGPLAIGVITMLGGVGVISFGGIGIVSFGGGALGVVAVGGGACGVIAVGGGALGYIAIGGGALGVYVLAGGGKGQYVFDRRRQDPEAVEFFCKWVPRLRTAFTAEPGSADATMDVKPRLRYDGR
jgi:hypothetical protein